MGVVILLVVVAIVLQYGLAPNLTSPVPEHSAILITGASTGIGKHAALELAVQGFTVLAGVRKAADGESLLQEFKLEHPEHLQKLIPIIIDVTSQVLA